MRSTLLLIVLAGFIPVSWIHPFIGVLVWSWLTFMNPHQVVWGLATELRLNLVISIVTVLGFLISRENKSLPSNLTVFLLFIFAFIWIISTQMAMAPELADDLLVRHLKTFALLLMVMFLANNRVRLHALVFVMVLSIGYFGVYGGIVGIITGGNSHFSGPPNSMIADNNHLALAIVVTLPLANYLRMYSKNKAVKFTLIAAMGLGVIAVLSTYSRGGFLGLMTMGALFWWKSKRKLLTLIVGAAIVIPAIQLMPEKWWSRMDTIENAADEDRSFQERVGSWETAFNLAVSNPIFGGGFSATQSRRVYQQYKAYGDPTGSRAAHSIYFQVMGDLGFVGLFVFLLILFTSWRNSVAIIRGAQRHKSLSWAEDLAKMLQVSMAGYIVAGAALSLAYYDLTLTMIVMLINLRVLVEKENALRVHDGTAVIAPASPATLSRFER